MHRHAILNNCAWFPAAISSLHLAEQLNEPVCCFPHKHKLMSGSAAQTEPGGHAANRALSGTVLEWF